MRTLVIKFLVALKGFLLLLRMHGWLGWLRKPFFTTANLIDLSRWAARQPKEGVMNDFYTSGRDSSRRVKLYAYTAEHHHLDTEAIDYLEFGVYNGTSFKWWVKQNTNAQSAFYGFDTFEGLPEDWGVFKKGEMSSGIPELDDPRVTFVKGLFQQSVPPFLKQAGLDNGKRKVIHMDADLFTSTLFALTSLAPYLKKGDIIMFDEFNVPNHEFLAFKLFSESFYVKTRLVAAVNNYYQVALIID